MEAEREFFTAGVESHRWMVLGAVEVIVIVVCTFFTGGTIMRLNFVDAWRRDEIWEVWGMGGGSRLTMVKLRKDCGFKT